MRIILLLCCALLSSQWVSAHPLAPAQLRLQASEPGVYAVIWQLPVRLPAAAALQLEFPAHCVRDGAIRERLNDSARLREWTLRCPGGLTGQTLGVAGLALAGVDALVQLELADGRQLQTVLNADQPRYVVPEQPQTAAVIHDYLVLGFVHLWGGLDHVLLVIGLCLLVPQRGRLLLTLTGFTLGHSVTLALAALGWVVLPAALVEVAIALTLVLLASAVLQRQGGGIARRPLLTASLFGLLHGLGFAGVLSEIGLPSGAVFTALLGFNLGLELGQASLVVLLWLLATPWQRRWVSLGNEVSWHVWTGVGLGLLSATWFWQRLLGG